MNINILVLTDAHLFHKKAITPEEYKSILDNFKDKVDIFVDCGDLTDKSNLSAEQLEQLLYLFKDINKPFYIVAGNHDSLNNTTVASILNLNPNIHVIRKQPQILDGMLFIPYTDNIKELYKNLDSLVKEPVDFAFSHLNLTSNFYASIPFKDSDKLHKYANTIINGHIHTYEAKENLYGNIYNIGACSSLTYNDEHFPCYTLIKDNNIQIIPIENSIIHRTFNSSEDFKQIEDLTKDNRLYVRFKLENNSDSLNKRKYIKESLQNNNKILGISFEYIKTKEKLKKQTKINTESLTEQLIKSFEQTYNIKLSEEIKKDLTT